MRLAKVCAAFVTACLGCFLCPAQAHEFTCSINNGAITITGYTGPGGGVTIPGEIGGLPVTSIGANAFYSQTNLATVALPDRVTSIGQWAFSTCTRLAEIRLGSGVTSLETGTFWGCASLANITIPPGVTSVEYATFAGCNRLASVKIPDGVLSLGDDAFSGCTSLAEVAIGNGVTSIGKEAFYNCPKLAAVTIPARVNRIGCQAFVACLALERLYFKGGAPKVDPTAFVGLNSLTVYHLPGATGWSSALGGRPVVLWNPQVKIGDASFGVQNHRFGFTITGTSGLVVVVEACAGLANPAWLPLQTNSLAGGSSYFNDPQWTNYSSRSYRLRMP